MSLSPKSTIADMRQHLDELERELSSPGIAKARDLRDASRAKIHCAFRASVDALLESIHPETQRPWSMRAIARHIETDISTVCDWYERGDQKRSQIPGWVFAALPAVARVAWMRVVLEWSDPPPGRTGTCG